MRWLELIKDYDLGINNHPGKANVVAVGGHKMHIFTDNIPTFHSRYRR
jgi:hypothetical protein